MVERASKSNGSEGLEPPPGAGGDITIAQLHLLVQCFVRPSTTTVVSPAAAAPEVRGPTQGSSETETDDAEQLMLDNSALTTPPPSLLRRLSEEEFTKAVSAVLTQFEPSEIATWFRRIDADDQKSVSWTDFSAFLLSRASYHQRPADLRGSDFAIPNLPPAPPAASDCHTERITRIRYHPKTGRLFTGSVDGTLRAWSWADLSHQKFVFDAEAWITDMCFIRNDTRLLVTAVDRSVTVIDTRSFDIMRVYAGRPVASSDPGYAVDVVERRIVPPVRNERSALGLEPSAVSSLCRVNFGPKRRHSDTVRRMELGVLSGLCDVPNSVCSLGMRANDDLISLGCRDGAVRLYSLPTSSRRCVSVEGVLHPHGEYCCNQVEWSNHLSGLITCGDDRTLRISNPDRIDDYIVRSFDEGGHQRPVLGFAWSDIVRVLASFSNERVVYFWDRLQSHPTNRLAALSSPVRSLAFQEQNYQLLVHTQDNVLRIFDLRTNTVLQTLTDHHISKDCGPLSASIFAGHRIVAGATYPIAYITRRELGTTASNYHGHVRPCLYFTHSDGADSLVSVDSDTAYVWNVKDGSLRFSFGVASFHHSMSVGEMKLTSACSDSSSRRLVTGFHRGAVVVWNISNGQPLAQLTDARFSGRAITATHTVVRHGATFYIVAAGSLVGVCENTSKQYTLCVRECNKIPAICGDVVCIASAGANTIVCGTSVGAILMLNIITLAVEGEPLFPPVTDPEGTLSISLSQQHNTSKSVEDTGDGVAAGVATVDASSTAGGVRVELIHLLEGSRTEPHLLVAYANGRFVLWNALWRTAAAMFHINTISGFPTAFSVLQVATGTVEELVIVHGDDGGNLYATRALIPYQERAAVSSTSTPGVVGISEARRSTSSTTQFPHVVIAQNSLLVAAFPQLAVSALHGFRLESLEVEHPGPNSFISIYVSVAAAQHIEAKLFLLKLPGVFSEEGAVDHVHLCGVLGAGGWGGAESSIVPYPAHFSPIESLLILSPTTPHEKASPDSVGVAKDTKSVLNLLGMLNGSRRNSNAEGDSARRALPTPPKTAAWALPRRRGTLDSLIPSSGDKCGSTVTNPVHIPPRLVRTPGTKVHLGKAAASTLITPRRPVNLGKAHRGKGECEASDVSSDDPFEPTTSRGGEESAPRPPERVPWLVASPKRGLDSSLTGPYGLPLLPDGMNTESRLAREAERLAKATDATSLHRRIVEAREKIRPKQTALTPRSGDRVDVDWTVRASARLTPRPLDSYRSPDLLLDVLQEKNPAAASRAMMPGAATTSVFGLLSRTRHFPPKTDNSLTFAMPPNRAPS